MKPGSSRFCVNRELLATNQEFNCVSSIEIICDLETFYQEPALWEKWPPVMFYKTHNRESFHDGDRWVNGARFPLIFPLACK